MDEVRRGELEELLFAFDNVTTHTAHRAKTEEIIRWVEAREAEAYERAASTQARLMACAPKGGRG